MLKSERRETQKFKKRYGSRRHKVLGINKLMRKRKALKEENKAKPETGTVVIAFL